MSSAIPVTRLVALGWSLAVTGILAGCTSPEARRDRLRSDPAGAVEALLGAIRAPSAPVPEAVGVYLEPALVPASIVAAPPGGRRPASRADAPPPWPADPSAILDLVPDALGWPGGGASEIDRASVLLAGLTERRVARAATTLEEIAAGEVLAEWLDTGLGELAGRQRALAKRVLDQVIPALAAQEKELKRRQAEGKIGEEDAAPLIDDIDRRIGVAHRQSSALRLLADRLDGCRRDIAAARTLLDQDRAITRGTYEAPVAPGILRTRIVEVRGRLTAQTRPAGR